MRLTFDFIVLCMVAAYAAAAHVSTVEDRGVPQKAHLQEGNGKIIPEEYIVIFKEQTSDDTGMSILYAFKKISGFYEFHSLRLCTV